VISQLKYGEYKIYYMKRMIPSFSGAIKNSQEQIVKIGRGETFNFWQMHSVSESDASLSRESSYSSCEIGSSDKSSGCEGSS
jgi:hypothetical protein